MQNISVQCLILKLCFEFKSAIDHPHSCKLGSNPSRSLVIGSSCIDHSTAAAHSKTLQQSKFGIKAYPDIVGSFGQVVGIHSLCYCLDQSNSFLDTASFGLFRRKSD